MNQNKPDDEYDIDEINEYLREPNPLSMRAIERLKGWGHSRFARYIEGEILAGRLVKDLQPKIVQYRRIKDGGKND